MNTYNSSFDGKMIQWFGWVILGGVITSITAGLGFPWAFCMLSRWKINHSVINGKRLKFNGTGGSLFGRWILWWLLLIVTLGIFGLWLSVKLTKWEVERTSFGA
jgi:uncharacterized membrane protein YjgN (DUF898 family)